jgi:hypothetical protein
MKKNILISIAILVTVCLSFQQLNGQEQSQDQKEKDAKLQQAIELQKKQMADQKKLEDQQQLDLNKVMRDAEDASRNAEGLSDYYRRDRPGRDFGDQSFYFSPGIDFEGNAFFAHGGDRERTTWDFSKYVKEASFSRQYSFDVEKSVGTVVMTVMGDCKSGEIRVKIVMPGGKTYSDIVIDESGNLNWRKSFTISESENKDKAGEWIFKIDAAKATGSFKISLQTY